MDCTSSPSAPLLHHELEVAAAAGQVAGAGQEIGGSGNGGKIKDSISSPVRKRGRVRGLPSLLAVNALVCGVEIVSSAAFTFIPPLLLKAGYTETVMTIILGIGK